mmetsp:Transcript_23617/g.48305  ORF Transcript_23617/g.48305 Transcript_23617/m.48305 type:complete len:305 (+) Transcript_23617:212-1126(+)
MHRHWGISVREPSALSITSTRVLIRSKMSSKAVVSAAIISIVTVEVRLNLNSVRWSLACVEHDTMLKSPPRLSMISRAWLMSPESNKWPCSSTRFVGQLSTGGRSDRSPATDPSAFLIGQPALRRAVSRRGWYVSARGTSGRRRKGEGHRPMAARAHLTGMGLASQKRSRCRAASGASAASALDASPLFAASITAAMALGATFAVTEMTPSPPCSTYSRAMESSPEYSRNSSPQMARMGPTRELSPVASFSPAIFGCLDSATVASTDRSTPVRPGTLYSTMGMFGQASAMAVKCACRPSEEGFT